MVASRTLEVGRPEAFSAGVVALVAVAVLVRILACGTLLQTGGEVHQVAAHALDALVQVRPETRPARELAGSASRWTRNYIDKSTRRTLGYAVGRGCRGSEQVIVSPASCASLERSAGLACGTTWPTRCALCVSKLAIGADPSASRVRTH